jgi:predicted nucleic acid-binding protein
LKAIEIYHKIPVRYAETELEDTLRIAAEYNIYSYDAYLLRCALKYNAPLISLDRNLVRIAKEMNVVVIEVQEE